MKLSVRKKIANGLVVFLLVPRAAETAIDIVNTYIDGVGDMMGKYSADEDFDLNSARATKSITVTETDDPTTGDPSDGDPTDGDPTGGDPTGGDPTGGDPTGGDPTGGDPTGGDPTGGDPTGGDPTGGDPTGGDPTGGDPTGGDPTGGDPTACPPGTTAPPSVEIKSASELVTAEDGSADLFEISLSADPQSTQFYYFVSTDPNEAIAKPGAIAFGQDACVPRSIKVIGQNDNLVDGDQDYEILVLDQQDFIVDTIPGINLDNDDYESLAVGVLGPNSIPLGGSAVYQIRVVNQTDSRQRGARLTIKPSEGLIIGEFAASLLSGDQPTVVSKLKRSGDLVFKRIRLEAGDAMVVSVEVTLEADNLEDQKLTAEIRRRGLQTDDEQPVRPAVP